MLRGFVLSSLILDHSQPETLCFPFFQLRDVTERAPNFQPENLCFFFLHPQSDGACYSFFSGEPLFLFYSSEESLAHNHLHESSFTTFFNNPISNGAQNDCFRLGILRSSHLFTCPQRRGPHRLHGGAPLRSRAHQNI